MTSDLLLTSITRKYESAGEPLEILRGVDLEMSRGESLAITGPSGSGKSTLLYIVGTLEEPSSGDVMILGERPFDLKAARLAAWRNANVGFIFQDHHLLPQCSVLENVLVPTLAGPGAGDAETDRAQSLLERVGLQDRIHHRPAQISGGERQRVAVCRALINQPALLLADEPTGNLDQATAESIGSLLLDLSIEQNTMMICVTHSIELADRFPRHVRLQNGKLVDA
jgi:lipoprotein-releasing system ATP-binding protein